MGLGCSEDTRIIWEKPLVPLVSVDQGSCFEDFFLSRGDFMLILF